MRAELAADGSLVVGENPTWLRLLLFCLGGTVVAAVAHEHPGDGGRLLLGGLGALLPVGGAALLERVRFEFDVAQRRLRWRRQSWLRRRAGELPFSEIADVVLRVRHERESERRQAREVPSYYVALVTAAGDLRLSDRIYRDEPGQRRIAEAIRQALGLSPAPAAPAPESIEQLARAGEVVEAIKLARRLHGIGLAEAKQLVDRMRGSSRPRVG
jgi:hypothetical protein